MKYGYSLFLTIMLIAGLMTSLIAIKPIQTVQAASIIWVSPDGNDNNPGTETQPFRTIQKAADVAQPGDTVYIKPGIYYEQVVLPRAGTPDAPITFQSTERWGAVLEGTGTEVLLQGYGFQDSEDSGPVQHIIIRGLVFRNGHSSDSVKASANWRIEDCKAEDGGGFMVRGGNNYLIRCVAEDTDRNGMTGAHGFIMVKDCITRRCNQTAFSPGGYAGACKFLYTENAIFDGITSYDNYGSGWWLDWDNRNFTIKNSSFFGNHAGVGWEGEDENGDRNYNLDQSWAGAGIWIECNPSGLIDNCYIWSNVASGIGDFESGFDGGLTITNNVLVDNGAGIEFRAIDRGGGHVLGAANIQYNKFKSWVDRAILTSLDGTIDNIAKPGDMGIVVDNNIYDKGSNNVYFKWVNTYCYSLAEDRSKLSVEANGTDGTIDFDYPLFDTYSLTRSDIGDPEKMHQVYSPYEDITIDDAVSGKSTGDTVTIPAFRRGSFTGSAGSWTCEVFDLQARALKLVNLSDSDKEVLESLVPVHANIHNPIYLDVTLTKLDPYDFQAVLGEGGYIPPTPTPTPTPTQQPGTPVYRINAGGSAVTPYSGDDFFSGGSNYSVQRTIITDGISNPAPQDVYRCYRWVHGNGNTFSYTLPGLTPGNGYRIRLHFADIYNSSAGQRKFHIDINGERVLTDFDIIAEAGQKDRAIVKEFDANADSAGKIDIVFTATSYDSACVNGIEVLTLQTATPTPAPTPTPTPAPVYNIPVCRINAGGSAVEPYAADGFFTGGSVFSVTRSIDISGLDDPAPHEVYKSYRWVHGSGNSFNYSISGLTEGNTYKLRLHFADIYNSSAGQRKFHVDINGTRVLTDFDIIGEAGAKDKAVIREFTAEAGAGGIITLTFTATNYDSACVNGIEILAAQGGGGTPVTVYQVNTGGSGVSGFEEDNYYTGGSNYSVTRAIDLSAVTDPAPEAVYRSYRWVHGNGNSFEYDFTGLTPGSIYKLRLHFADIYNSSAGQRRFHVNINGERVLTDFDIIGEAGAPDKAVIKEFFAAADSTGRINMEFIATAFDSACINGIQIIANP